MSQRQLIRKATRDRLKGQTDAGDSVVTNRTQPTWIEDLPFILIYTRDESSERFDESPKRYRRVLSLEIEAISKGANDGELEDNLDRLAQQIETLIEKDDTLGKDCDGNVVADRMDLVSTRINVQSDGQSPAGAVILTYAVVYYTEPAEQCFPDFVQTNADWQVGHHDESSDSEIDAQDEIQLPQV